MTGRGQLQGRKVGNIQALRAIAVLSILVLAAAGARSLLGAGSTPAAHPIEPARMAAYHAMFPDLSDDAIAALFSVTYRQVYTPWVDFRNADIDTPLVHSRGFVRTTEPAVSGNAQAFDIFFFGGSTMHGVHVPDDRTLPSAFMQLAARDGIGFRATNFGQPYYYLKQEALLFLNMLIDGQSPKVAVFLDGLNDVIAEGAIYSRAPFFAPAYEHVFAHLFDPPPGLWLRIRTAGQAVDRRIPPELIEGGFHLPAGVDPDVGHRKSAEAYVANVRAVGRACEANGVLCLFFLQPVPFLHYDRDKDPLVDQRSFPQFKTSYDFIRAELADLRSFQAIDDAFADSPEITYVDAFHYSPLGNRILAKIIYQRVRQVMDGQAAR